MGERTSSSRLGTCGWRNDPESPEPQLLIVNTLVAPLESNGALNEVKKCF